MNDTWDKMIDELTQRELTKDQLEHFKSLSRETKDAVLFNYSYRLKALQERFEELARQP